MNFGIYNQNHLGIPYIKGDFEAAYPDDRGWFGMDYPQRSDGSGNLGGRTGDGITAGVPPT